MFYFTCDRSFSHDISQVASPAIDKVGPRPYQFRLGPTSGPTTRQEAKTVKLKSPLKRHHPQHSDTICQHINLNDRVCVLIA